MFGILSICNLFKRMWLLRVNVRFMIQILHMELHYWFRLKNLCLIYDICMISLNTLEEFVKSENIFKGKMNILNL